MWTFIFRKNNREKLELSWIVCCINLLAAARRFDHEAAKRAKQSTLKLDGKILAIVVRMEIKTIFSI